jgi:dTDP-4-dehydrorhamnose reductase
VKVLVTGASGGLGRYVCQVATELGWATLTPPRAELDLVNPYSINVYLDTHAPDVVLHLAGLANVDRCQQEPQEAVHINTLGTLHLAKLSKRVVFMSTNDVFSELPDAGIPGPYNDQTVPAPGNAYTWSKYAGEQAVLASGGVVVRANFFTRYCRAKESFVAYVLRNARERRPFDCYTNVIACPVFAETLAKVFCTLATGSSGIFHVGTVDAVNRLEQAQMICEAYGLDSSFAQGKPLANRAGRPLDARLIPSAGIDQLFVDEEINKLLEAEPL